MKRLILLSSIAILLSGCNSLFFETTISKDNKLAIVRNPDPEIYDSAKMDSLQTYNENAANIWAYDFRCRNLSNLDLKNNLTELLHSDFDSKTVWPTSLPAGFIPDSIMEIGKNPGLNIRKLHQSGITGNGVAIAIIDQPILINHCEYKGRLKMYEEIHVPKKLQAQMHGLAVTSLAVGKTTGVAPEADLYYIATTPYGSPICSYVKYVLFRKFDLNLKWYVKAIYRILEINRTLPEDKKIRVISISFGGEDKSFIKAIEQAEKEGVFVVSSSISHTHNLRFNGLGKDYLTNPDDPNSYFPGLWWSKNYYKNPDRFKIDSTLLVPMDSRCTASQSGDSNYVFYSDGGWSWSIPYIAGLYALACQVKPDITPHEFWNKALETGDIIDLQKDGKKLKFGKIVNPTKLINSLKR